MGLFDKLNQPIFLKEESDANPYICQLKALQEKATGAVKDRIDKEIKLASIGELGEKNIVFELKNSGMPMYVMHDVHYEINGLSAQIDFIVVTRKLIFLIECKNLIGNIEIDHQGNFVRNFEFNGKRIKEGIYSPITQNQRHLEILKQLRRESKSNLLMKLLFDKHFEDNYKSIVVLANPKTILNDKYAKKEVKQMVIRADRLNSYIKEMYNQSKSAVFNDKELKEFAEGLLAMATPNTSDYARKYEEIINDLAETDDVKKNPGGAQKAHAEQPIEAEPVAALRPCDHQVNLIKNLKAWRLSKSREEDIKPYYIFNDMQMMDLVAKMPKTKVALQGVSGFGPVKAEKYGDAIIKILDEFS